MRIREWVVLLAAASWLGSSPASVEWEASYCDKLEFSRHEGYNCGTTLTIYRDRYERTRYGCMDYKEALDSGRISLRGNELELRPDYWGQAETYTLSGPPCHHRLLGNGSFEQFAPVTEHLTPDAESLWSAGTLSVHGVRPGLELKEVARKFGQPRPSTHYVGASTFWTHPEWYHNGGQSTVDCCATPEGRIHRVYGSQLSRGDREIVNARSTLQDVLVLLGDHPARRWTVPSGAEMLQATELGLTFRCEASQVVGLVLEQR